MGDGEDVDHRISQHDAGRIKHVPSSGLVQEANKEAEEIGHLFHKKLQPKEEEKDIHMLKTVEHAKSEPAFQVGLDKETMMRQVSLQKKLQLTKLHSEDEEENRDIIRTAQNARAEAATAKGKSWDHIMSNAPLLSMMYSIFFEEPSNQNMERVDKQKKDDAQSVI